MRLKTKKVLQFRSQGEPEIIAKQIAEKANEVPVLSFLSQASEIGFSIALPISLGALFGLWLDKKYVSHPKYTLSFLFVGIVLSFVNLFYIVRVFSKKVKK